MHIGLRKRFMLVIVANLCVGVRVWLCLILNGWKHLIWEDEYEVVLGCYTDMCWYARCNRMSILLWSYWSGATQYDDRYIAVPQPMRSEFRHLFNLETLLNPGGLHVTKAMLLVFWVSPSQIRYIDSNRPDILLRFGIIVSANIYFLTFDIIYISTWYPSTSIRLSSRFCVRIAYCGRCSMS